MLRRELLQGIGATGFLAGLTAKVQAADLKEIRIGYQKAGFLIALKQRQSLETAFRADGINVRWVEFAFGPPILEGINTGNLDFGFTGDAPPIFAQAAIANLVYAAALPGHTAEGILVHEDSGITTLADLKGKKVGVGKASSAHTTLLYALDKAGLAFTDIQPVYLAPADAAAAFARGSLDAWAIWDPYLALGQQGKVRTLVYAKEVHHPNQFFLANKAFAQQHGEVLTKLLDTIAVEIKWASEHRDLVAQAVNEASGIDLRAIREAAQRAHYELLPISPETVKSQQEIADKFLQLKLLPKPVAISDVVWKWTPSV
jgi:sulfonate transport system substrate-binding protein